MIAVFRSMYKRAMTKWKKAVLIAKRRFWKIFLKIPKSDMPFSKRYKFMKDSENYRLILETIKRIDGFNSEVTI